MIDVNDVKCGNDKRKVDCSEDIAVGDSNSNVDGFPNDHGDGDTYHEVRDGDHNNGESNDSFDWHKKDDNYHNGGCFDSVRNCFINKQIDLENFSLPISTR